MTWPLATFALLALVLAAGFAWYERSHPTAKVLALVATLAALAALGRVAFAPLPNVKPTTDVVLLAGYALGGAPGFAVGAVAALASNVVFGQGPWTPWQMAAWGGVGVFGALLGALFGPRLGRVALAAACGVAGLAYGAVLDLHLWVLGTGHTLEAYGVLAARGLPFNVAHAVGNVVFCLAFGPLLVRALQRYRERLEVRWVPLAAGSVLALALVASPATARAQGTAVQRATGYLERAQNADGGFGAAPDQASNPMHTAWAVLGLAAAGRDPAAVREGGRSPVDYTLAQLGRVRQVADVERTVLALAAGGASPRSARGRDLVAEVVRARRPDGSFARQVNVTAFAVLALRAAGRRASDRVVRGAARWIVRQQNPDGGFSFATRGAASGVDDTAAALQALVAAGRGRGGTVRRAAAFLAEAQNADGGFPLSPGGASNAQSTAWAAQALVAAGRDPSRALRHLRSLQGRDGAVRYSRTSRQTPVWVTAQALAALAREPLPIAAVRRVRRAAAPADRPAGADAPPPSSGSEAGRAEGGDAGAAPPPAPARGAAPAPAAPSGASARERRLARMTDRAWRRALRERARAAGALAGLLIG